MFDELEPVLASDARIRYALVFGSRARGNARPDSDLDVAVSVSEPLDALEVGDLIARLESASGHTVDLIFVDEAPPALAYRVFRAGTPVFVRDRRAMVQRKARAILEYLDFKPIEDICVRGVLEAAKRGR